MVDIAGIEIQIKQTGAQRATSDLSRLERQSGRVETATQRMERSFQSLKRNVFSLQSAFAGLAVGMAAFQAIKIGANFEQQMAKVRGITQSTQSEFIALTNIAKELGATTEWSATQAAQGLEFLAMAGFSAEKAIKALPSVIDLATAGNIDLGRAADIASNALTAMRLPVESLSHVNDVFIKTIISSNTNMEMMAESFKYSAPLAAAYGIKIERLAALIGLLGNAGIQGSMAGTQLAMAMQRSAEVFKKYGVSAKNADGSTKDFVDALKLLEERGGDTNEIMKVFTVRAGRAALALLGQGVPAITAYIKEVEAAKDVTSELANIMRDTLTGDVKTLKSTLEDLAISGFKEYGTSLRSFVQETTEYFRKNKEEIIELTVSIGKVAEDLGKITLLVGALGAKTLKIWNELPQPVREVGLITAIIGGKPAIKAIALVALLNSQLSRLGMGLTDLGKAFGDLEKSNQNIWDVLIGKKDWHTGVVRNIEDLETAFAELHTAQGSIWVERGDMDAYLNSLNDGTESASENVKNLGDDGAGAFAAMESAAKEANKEFDKFWKKLVKHKLVIDKVALAALPKYERALESIRRKYDELNKALDEHGVLAGKTTEEIAELHKDLSARMMDEVGNFAESFAKDIRGTVEDTEKATKEIDELWVRAMDRVQSTLADTFMDAIKGKLDSFKDVFKSFCDVLLRYWAEMLAQMAMQSNILKGLTSGLGSLFGGLFGGVGNALGGGVSGQDGAGVLGQGLQEASTAWSLQQAYSAYNLAGGGWGGVKAGAGSFFGMGAGGAVGTPAAANWSMVGGFPTATVGGGTGAAGAGSLAGLATYAGYAGAGMLIGSLIDKIRGHDVEHPEYAAYGGAAGAVAGGFVGGATLGASYGSWGGWIGAAVGAIVGGVLGSFMGGSKKRSYLTREYDYGYGLAGWEETGMEETKVKREGADFRKAAEGMSGSVVEILNSVDDLTTGFLEIINEKWVNQFQTAMMTLGELGFKFDISAEDKGEFEDDIEASFSSALEGVINPVVAVATDFMRRATEEAFTSPEIEKVFGILRDDVAQFLKDDMAQVLAIFDAPLPTTQKEFEAYIKDLEANLQEVGAIIDYFQIITDITEEISSGLARSSLTQSLMDINVKFIKLGETLTSVGIDLEKYPDFVRAWGIALAEATYGFSVDNVIAGLKEIMDLPSAMEAAEAFTLGFMEQVRDGMVNAITSAFTEMIYAQMLAPLAEEFLAGAETPEELKEAAKAYVAAMSDLMKDPEMIDLLKSVGEIAWELNQMIPSAEDLATARDVISESAVELADGGSTAGDLLVEGAGKAANLLANACKSCSGPEATPAQHGLIATRPTYTHIAEAGYPEVVLPLDGKHKLRAQLEGGGGAQEVVVTIPLTIVTEDGWTLKQETIRETLSEIKSRSKHREFVMYSAGVR